MSHKSLPEHINKPDLRPLLPRRTVKDGQPFVALCDPAQLTQETLVVSAKAVPALEFFHGEETLQQIATRFNSNVAQLAQFVQRLDQFGLLRGPTFERLQRELLAKIDAKGLIPATTSQSIGESEQECRGAIDEYLDEAGSVDPPSPAMGIVAPHQDYGQSWRNYAAAYDGFAGLDRPDRVVILGTNHEGAATGVVLSQYGFETPMGPCPADTAVIGKLKERLGDPLTAGEHDHLVEHSIQMHMPWIRYFFGSVPMIAALIPDPFSESGEAVTGPQFVEALREVLDEAGGDTRFVASSDLSHVGPKFGEQDPVDDKRRVDVERHDMSMLARFQSGDAKAFLASFRQNGNPTRWCSIGGMAALLELVQPGAVDLVDYHQAADKGGIALITTAAMMLFE